MIDLELEPPLFIHPDPPREASEQALVVASKSIRYLWDKMYNNNVFGANRATFLAPAEEHAKVKSIGGNLNEEGGLPLMEYVANFLLSEVCMYCGEEMTYAKYLEWRLDLCELGRVWNGIGEWKREWKQGESPSHFILETPNRI